MICVSRCKFWSYIKSNVYFSFFSCMELINQQDTQDYSWGKMNWSLKLCSSLVNILQGISFLEICNDHIYNVLRIFLGFIHELSTSETSSNERFSTEGSITEIEKNPPLNNSSSTPLKNSSTEKFLRWKIPPLKHSNILVW